MAQNRPYGVRAVPTWKMTPVELARTWAAHYGYTARPGGWVYDPRGRAVVQGWDAFAALLRRRQLVLPGVGIDWRTSGETPRIRRAG